MMMCFPPTSIAKFKALPIFSPNQYFWDNHWDSANETKVDAYMKAIRQIMLRESGLKDSEAMYIDRFEFIKVKDHQDELKEE